MSISHSAHRSIASWIVEPARVSFVLLLAAAVGNIPYDVTEEMLTDVFKTAGPIKAMR